MKQTIKTNDIRRRRRFSKMKQSHYSQLRILKRMAHYQKGTREDPIDVDAPQEAKQKWQNMIDIIRKEVECPICFETISKKSLVITTCGHKFCKSCYYRIDRCALCRAPFVRKHI